MKRIGLNQSVISFINVICEILAIFTIALWLLTLVNGAIASYGGTATSFIPADVLVVLEQIRYWATLAVLALVGLKLAFRNIFFFILYVLFVAGIVILMFFPDVFTFFGDLFTGKNA